MCELTVKEPFLYKDPTNEADFYVPLGLILCALRYLADRICKNNIKWTDLSKQYRRDKLNFLITEISGVSIFVDTW